MSNYNRRRFASLSSFYPSPSEGKFSVETSIRNIEPSDIKIIYYSAHVIAINMSCDRRPSLSARSVRKSYTKLAAVTWSNFPNHLRQYVSRASRCMSDHNRRVSSRLFTPIPLNPTYIQTRGYWIRHGWLSRCINWLAWSRLIRLMFLEPRRWRPSHRKIFRSAREVSRRSRYQTFLTA